METTSSTWSFSSSRRLIACGIDSERIDRFRGWASEPARAPSFVFTGREIGHACGLADAALGLCASFCCKEAVFKALGGPYDFTDCEFFMNEDEEPARIHLSEGLRSKHRVREALAAVRRERLEAGELIVVAYLLG
jgi:phosphopantetheinyl transferase (holo-ACP synthase)